MAFRSLEQAYWLDRCNMGCLHLGAVHVAYPITSSDFNYTPVVVLGVLVLVTIWWLASARHWFKGPIVQGSEAELEAIEHAVGERHLPGGIEGVAGGGE